MIVILGASGFIGRNLANYLINKGYDVLPVYFSNRTLLKNEIDFENFIISKQQIDKIIFCGGNSSHYVPEDSLFKIIKKDSEYIQRVLDKFNNTRNILVSSAAVYYGYEGMVDETINPRPNMNYGLSKRIAEMIFEKEIYNKKSSGTVLRLTHVYGKGERDNRLFRNIAKAIKHSQVFKIYGEGNSYINPIPTSFLCEVVTHFLNEDLVSPGVEYYNVGSKENVTVKEIVSKLKNYFNFDYIIEGEEKCPVYFKTNVEKLEKVGLCFENAVESVVNYVCSISQI